MSPAHKHSRRLFCNVCALVAVQCLYVRSAIAQTACCRKIVVTGAPGTLVDQLARTVAVFLGRVVRGEIVIENRPGIGGLLAAQEVARSAPDGNTLLFAANETLVFASALARGPTIDPTKDLRPVAMVARTPLALIVSQNANIHDLRDFITKAKSDPNRYTFAAGTGGSIRFATEEFNRSAGVRLQIIPYKGVAQAAQSVSSGEVQAAFVPFPVVTQPSVARTAKILAVTGAAIGGGVPSFSQQGLPEVDVDQSYALLAPKETSNAKMGEIEQAVGRAVQDSEFKSRLAAINITSDFMTGAAFDAKLRRESDRWARFVREANVKPE